MAVVINEFEVVPAEPAAPQAPGATTSEEKETSASPSEHEVERTIERQRTRYARVWAH